MFLLHFRFRRKYRFSCAVQMFARYKFDKAILPRVLESREEWYSYSSPRARLPAGTGNDAVRSANGRIKRYPSVWIPDVFSFLFFSLFPLFFPRNSNNNGSFSILHNARERWFFAFAHDFTSKIDLKRDFLFRKKENLVFWTLSIFLLSFSSLSRIFHPRSIEIEISRGASKNIFRKYFEKEDIPGYIYSRRRTTNKEIKRIYRGILGDIFSKRQRNILYAGKMLKIHAYPLPFFLRERTGRLPFSRVALGSGTIAVFPCNLFPFSPPQPSVSKHFVNHLSVARARAEFVSWDSDDTEALINLRHPASEEINLSNSWHAGRDKIGRIKEKNI